MKLFCILGNGNPEKIPYISGNRTFTFRKMETPEKFLF